MSIGTEVVGHVGVIEMQEPPHNFLNVAQIRAIADALDEFAKDMNVRAAVDGGTSERGPAARPRICTQGPRGSAMRNCRGSRPSRARPSAGDSVSP
jgi:hypothetical protein